MIDMYGNWTIEVTGTEYPHSKIHFLRNYPFKPKIIDVHIPKWVAAISGDETLKVLRDGVNWTEGRIKKIRPYRHGEGVGMRLTGYTNEWGSKDADVDSRTYNVDPATIVQANINARISEGTVNAYGSTVAMEFGATDNSLYKQLKALAEVPFVTGMELYLNPSSSLDLKTACGTDRSTTVIFKEGDRLLKWKTPHTKDLTQKASQVVVLGAFSSDLNDVARGVAGSGTPIHTEERRNLIDDDTCGKAAAALYADIQNDLYYGSFWAALEAEGVPFDVYDTIRVESDDYGVADDYRVSRIEGWVDKQGQRLLVSYCNLTKLTSNGPILLDRATGMLVAGQRAIADISRQALHVIDLTALDANNKVDLSQAGVTGAAPVDRLATTIGVKPGATNYPSHTGEDEYSRSNSAWATTFEFIPLPAIDGVAYVLTHRVFELKSSDNDVDHGSDGRMQYSTDDTTYVTIGDEEENSDDGPGFISYPEDITDIELSVGDPLYMRMQQKTWGNPFQDTCTMRRPIFQYYCKSYRRDLA